jgi:hypothetical protein
LQDASRLVAFTDQGQDLTDQRYEVRIRDVALACEVARDDDRQRVVAEMKILFQAEKGPASRGDAVDFRYFVAIADPERNILRRESFEASVTMPGNQTRAEAVETLAPTLPLPAEARPAGYRVLVGFELTRAQLDYNRANPP